MAEPVGRLTRRAEFLRVAATRRKAASPGLVLQDAPTETGTGVRAGFTVTKKVGNAVVRNRAKRRLRAAAAEVLPRHAKPGHDFVLIGRSETLTRDFADLIEDLKGALGRLGAYRP